MKKMYVDIGELGWSLLLSAHVKWVKKNTTDHIGVMTHTDRRCLYNGIVDAVYDLPKDFYSKFRRDRELYFGFQGVKAPKMDAYFAARIPPDYELRGFFHCKISREEMIFKPYAHNRELNGKKEILVLPRCRHLAKAHRRNLPEHFYVKLIRVLCYKFPDYIIRAIGIPSGSYNINGIKNKNYVNDVQEGADLQELIDRCQVAVVAVGSQSGPPKMTLLQGVPTFMIGHQRMRHMDPDNWMSTKAEFYDVVRNQYHDINVKDCIEKIVSFAEAC